MSSRRTTPASLRRAAASFNRLTPWGSVVGHTGDGAVAPGSYELQFSVAGQTLNHSLIKDPEYQVFFRKPGDHTFSQCVDYYMETEGYASQFDTHSWLTVAGEGQGISGYVHGWKQNRGMIRSTKILPYNGC